jgi:DNA-binding YbaB/EbfC family protein
MRSKMQSLGEELKAKRVSGTSGGGLIEVEVNGLKEVLSVRIDPSLIEKQDREMIEDLLPAAFNAAAKKAEELHAQAMSSLTGGMDIPGLGDALSQFTGTLPGGESK